MRRRSISSPPRILLTGVTGQVGGALLHLLASYGEVVAPTRAQLDLADPVALRALVRDVRPRWIVNPGAYTAVDRAESDSAAAFAINAQAPEVLGEEAARLGATVLHFSTDYVFSGTGTRPYTEQDPTGPTSVYGSSKLAGEQALAASGAAHFIFRTSWVYGATGRNFLLTILRAARERPELRIVADQHGAPTWSRNLARMATDVIAQCDALTAAGAPLPPSGLFHAAAAGETTWFGFAEAALAAERARHPGLSLATLSPIPTADYPTPARRPPNSRLDCTRLHQTFGFAFPPWEQSLAAALAELRP